MTQLSIQKALVDDRRRNLAALRHGSASPVRFEAERPAQAEPASLAGILPTGGG